VRRVVVVPGAPALLPSYAGLVDPLAEVRATAVAAVGWLVEAVPNDGAVVVVGAPADPANAARGVAESKAARVARVLLESAGFTAPVTESDTGAVPPEARALLVVADGSARRGEKAPGHLDERASGFDAAVDSALRHGDPAALRALDPQLGADLLAAGVPALRALGHAVERVDRAEVDYAGDPFGVHYWVVRWTCGS
jgi:hypothetical protein